MLKAKIFIKHLQKSLVTKELSYSFSQKLCDSFSQKLSDSFSQKLSYSFLLKLSDCFLTFLISESQNHPLFFLQSSAKSIMVRIIWGIPLNLWIHKKFF